MRNLHKSFISLMLVLIISISSVSLSFAASIRGDANFDGITNSTDALLILQYAVNRPVKNFDPYLFDVNGDGQANSTDALRVLQMTVNKDDPTKYQPGEVLKFYADALYTSYMETTEIEYTYQMNYRIGRWVSDNESSESRYESLPVNEIDADKIRYKNGKDNNGLTAKDRFVEPWVEDGAWAEAMISRNKAGYEVVIQLCEQIITPYDNGNMKTVTPYTGFSFAYGTPNVSKVWGQGVTLSLNYGTIVAQISFDGYVEEVNFRVPFNGNMFLASNSTSERLGVDILDGEYNLGLKFRF